VTLSFSRPQ